VNIPAVFSMYDIIANFFVEIVDVASSEMPISSGNGDAIIIPPRTGAKYFLAIGGIRVFIFLNIGSSCNSLISPEKECLMNWKISKSPINAPKPAAKPAKRMFCCFASISNIAVAGAAVKP